MIEWDIPVFRISRFHHALDGGSMNHCFWGSAVREEEGQSKQPVCIMHMFCVQHHFQSWIVGWEGSLSQYERQRRMSLKANRRKRRQEEINFRCPEFEVVPECAVRLEFNGQDEGSYFQILESKWPLHRIPTACESEEWKRKGLCGTGSRGWHFKCRLGDKAVSPVQGEPCTWLPSAPDSWLVLLCLSHVWLERSCALGPRFPPSQLPSLLEPVFSPQFFVLFQSHCQLSEMVQPVVFWLWYPPPTAAPCKISLKHCLQGCSVV